MQYTNDKTNDGNMRWHVSLYAGDLRGHCFFLHFGRVFIEIGKVRVFVKCILYLRDNAALGTLCLLDFVDFQFVYFILKKIVVC